MAESSVPSRGSSSGVLQKRPTIPHISEPREVLAELPVGHLLVVAEPLVALDPGVVVDVVLAAPAAEPLTEDVVLLELADCLQQVRWQAAEPERGEVVDRLRVEVLRVRLARVERVLETV